MVEFAKYLKKYLLVFSISLLLLFIVFIVNQFYHIYLLTSSIHPVLGKGILLFLVVLFGCVIALPMVMFLKLPKGLELPKDGDVAAYNGYIKSLQVRLRKNRYLLNKGFVFELGEDDQSQVKAAMKVLDIESDGIIKKYSSMIFITTAISQNGSLDGLFVLVNLSRMIWSIAHVYNQRPGVKELVKLYLNVGGTVLMAKEINDLNLLEEQLEPVVNALLGETLIASQTVMVSNLVVNSVIEGSANAFLSLRVGKIAMMHCSSLTHINRKKVRRAATLEACSLLGVVVRENTTLIVKSVIKGAGKATAGMFKKGKDKLFSFGSK